VSEQEIEASSTDDGLVRVRFELEYDGVYRRGDVVAIDRAQAEYVVRHGAAVWAGAVATTRDAAPAQLPRPPLPQPLEEARRAPYEAMRVPDLQVALEQRGLPTGGTKTELVDRLVAAGDGA